ncbi:MAG: hypothetical protein ACXADA_16970 [Candidatus Hodarchaeales archaeon]
MSRSFDTTYGQKKIIEVIQSANKEFKLLELKQKTKLANLYFFKALEELLLKGKIEKTVIDNETMIKLLSNK